VASRTVDHGDPAAVSAAEVQAEASLRAALGTLGRRAVVRWTTGPDAVGLHLRVRSPGVLPAALAAGLHLREIDRTFTVRIEELR
jgi:hypothetical protein